MRNAFADELTKLAEEDPRVVLLSGDIGNRLFNAFKEGYSERFFNCGVAEANMMSVAGGLALSGMRPVVYTITPFLTARCYEQIKIDVCYNRAPVLIVGVGAGLSYASLGPTHHSCDDIALLRLFPGMTVLCPCDAAEVRSALRAAVEHDGPVYMRIGKKGEPSVHDQVPAFTIGRAPVLRDGADLCMLATGNILPNVLGAADALAGDGISARVVNFHTVKPLDRDALEDAFSRYKLVVTIEEHGLAGGFGSSVAEWLVDRGAAHPRLVRLGTPDEFLHEAGDQHFARHHFGLSSLSIAARIKEELGLL